MKQLLPLLIIAVLWVALYCNNCGISLPNRWL